MSFTPVSLDPSSPASRAADHANVALLRILIPGDVLALPQSGFLTLRVTDSHAHTMTIGRLKLQCLASIRRKLSRHEIAGAGTTPNEGGNVHLSPVDFALAHLSSRAGDAPLDDHTLLTSMPQWQHLSLMLVKATAVNQHSTKNDDIKLESPLSSPSFELSSPHRFFRSPRRVALSTPTDASLQSPFSAFPLSSPTPSSYSMPFHPALSSPTSSGSFSGFTSPTARAAAASTAAATPIISSAYIDVCIRLGSSGYLRTAPTTRHASGVHASAVTSSNLDVGPISIASNWRCFEEARRPPTGAAGETLTPISYQLFQNAYTKEWLSWSPGSHLAPPTIGLSPTCTATSRWRIAKGAVQHIAMPLVADTTNNSHTQRRHYLALSSAPFRTVVPCAVTITTGSPPPTPPAAAQLHICFAVTQGILGRQRYERTAAHVPRSPFSSSPPPPSVYLPRFFVLTNGSLSCWRFPPHLLGSGGDSTTITDNAMRRIEQTTAVDQPICTIPTASIRSVTVVRHGGALGGTTPRHQPQHLRIEYDPPSTTPGAADLPSHFSPSRRPASHHLNLEVPSSGVRGSAALTEMWLEAFERECVRVQWEDDDQHRSAVRQRVDLIADRGVPLDALHSNGVKTNSVDAANHPCYDHDDEAIGNRDLTARDSHTPHTTYSTPVDWQTRIATPLPSLSSPAPSIFSPSNRPLSPTFAPPARQTQLILPTSPPASSSGRALHRTPAVESATPTSKPRVVQEHGDRSPAIKSIASPLPPAKSTLSPPSPAIDDRRSNESTSHTATDMYSVTAEPSEDWRANQLLMAQIDAYIARRAMRQSTPRTHRPERTASVERAERVTPAPQPHPIVVDGGNVDETEDLIWTHVVQAAKGTLLDATAVDANLSRDSSQPVAFPPAISVHTPPAPPHRLLLSVALAATPPLVDHISPRPMADSESASATRAEPNARAESASLSPLAVSTISAMSINDQPLAVALEADGDHLQNPSMPFADSLQDDHGRARVLEICLGTAADSEPPRYINATATSTSSSFKATPSLGSLSPASNWVLCESSSSSVKSLCHSTLRGPHGESLFLACDARGDVHLASAPYFWFVIAGEDHQVFRSYAQPEFVLVAKPPSDQGATPRTPILATARISASAVARAPEARFRICFAVVQGYMRKQSQKGASTPSSPTSTDLSPTVQLSSQWLRRFFVLSGPALAYFKTSAEWRGNVKPAGVYALVEIVRVVVGGNADGMPSLTLELHTGKRVRLLCDSAAHRAHWTEALQRKGIQVESVHDGVASDPSSGRSQSSLAHHDRSPSVAGSESTSGSGSTPPRTERSPTRLTTSRKTTEVVSSQTTQGSLASIPSRTSAIAVSAPLSPAAIAAVSSGARHTQELQICLQAQCHADDTDMYLSSPSLLVADLCLSATLGASTTWICIDSDESGVDGVRAERQRDRVTTKLFRSHAGTYLSCAPDGVLLLVRVASRASRWRVHKQSACQLIENDAFRGRFLARDDDGLPVMREGCEHNDRTYASLETHSASSTAAERCACSCSWRICFADTQAQGAHAR